MSKAKSARGATGGPKAAAVVLAGLPGSGYPNFFCLIY